MGMSVTKTAQIGNDKERSGSPLPLVLRQAQRAADDVRQPPAGSGRPEGAD